MIRPCLPKSAGQGAAYVHGSADKATKPSGRQLFYDAAGSKDKTLKLYTPTTS